MLFAPSWSCTCSSCQSPQSITAGVVSEQDHWVSMSPFVQPKLTRANLPGLWKTPLANLTPDLSSSASRKTVFRSPPFICRRSSQTRRRVGGVLSGLRELTFTTAVGGMPPELICRFAVLLALSLSEMKFPRHTPSSASLGMETRTMNLPWLWGSGWQEKPCRALLLGLVTVPEIPRTPEMSSVAVM